MKKVAAASPPNNATGSKKWFKDVKERGTGRKNARAF
jgi:hypothetical protein